MKKQITLFMVSQLSEKIINEEMKEKLAGFIKREATEGIDKVLDIIEDKVTDTHNKIDDAVVLPVCEIIRIALNIPDNDEDV